MAKHDGGKRTHIQGESKATVQRDSFFMSPGKAKVTKHFQTKQKKGEKKEDNSSNETPASADNKAENTKKPFDKKQWRIKKYSNKYKIEKWQEMRKKRIIGQYNKLTKKKDDKALDVQKIYEEYDEENSDSDNQETHQEKESSNKETVDKTITPDKSRKPKKTRQDWICEMKEEKMRKREEMLKKKAEREEAIKLSKKKKAERHKKLNKKTKKGQPIMKDRMLMLAEQIQKICQEG